MRATTRDRLRPLLRTQHFVVSTAQLLALGLDHRLPAREGWQRLAPALWLAAEGTPDDGALLVAARLAAGRRGVVSGALVCRALGLRDVPDLPGVDVVVPHGTQLRSGRWVRFRQARRVPPAVRLGTHAVAPLERAVADAARWAGDLRGARALVLGAVGDLRCTVDELERQLALGGRPGSAALRRAVQDAALGAASAPEAEAADLVRAVLGAPSFVLNAELVVDGRLVGRPDGWFVGRSVGWEVDSRRHHGGSVELDRTLQRHQRFGDLGLGLVHVTPARLRAEGRAWARELVARALASPPRDDVVVRARPPERRAS